MRPPHSGQTLAVAGTTKWHSGYAGATMEKRKRKRKAAVDDDTPLADILRGEARAVARLAESHRKTWQTLVPHMDGACPPELVRPLAAIDDTEGWLRRVFGAFQGLNPDDGAQAWYGFQKWFPAGILQHLPSTHPAVLTLAYKGALDDVDVGATLGAASLVNTIEEAGDSEAHRSLLGRALLLLARRSDEDGDLNGALDAAQRAEDIFAKLTGSTWSAWHALAIRVRVGALLRLRKIDDALALLDPVLAQVPPYSMREGKSRPPPTSADRIEGVLINAANVALTTTGKDVAWITALGAIGEALGHRVCGERFKAGQHIIDEARANSAEPNIWETFERQGRIV